MAEWKNRIDVKEVWKEAEDEPSKWREVAKALQEEIIRVQKHHHVLTCALDELPEIHDEFEELIRDPKATEDDFDKVLSRLYDWGDYNHNCWIVTAF